MSADAARIAQLAALARRVENAAPRVRELLRKKLAQGQADLPAPAAPEIAPIAVRPRGKARFTCEPLASLNRKAGGPAAGQDLPSAIRFRRSWSRSRAAERVVEASSSKPAQAGPLNSQVLMLESLELMRQLSPDYLRRFVAHAEALLWLEGAVAGAPQRKAAAKRRG